MYDVIIIGAGVTGSAVARELSRYKLNVCVLDKEEDVCCGTSKANSAIVHAGFDAATGSLMARFNVRGNEMMDQLSKDLDIPFKRNGALVVCIHESEKDGLKDLYDRGVANGVKGLQILSREEALEKEPNLSENVVAALYAPTSGIVCPFILNIAMAENACVNGVDFFFNTEVESSRPAPAKTRQSDLDDPHQQRLYKAGMSSTRPVSMRTSSTTWSVRKDQYHSRRATTACWTRPSETMSATIFLSPQSSARVSWSPDCPRQPHRRPDSSGYREQGRQQHDSGRHQ